MPKKFELKKSSAPASDEAHHPVVPVAVAEDEDDVVSRARGSRPKFSRTIPAERIHPNPWQARREFDQAKLEELASGMREHGWVGGGLPVRAHPTIPNEYQLVFGERRWRAAKLAALTALPCEVSSFSDDDMVEIGLIENIQRENLTNYEEGVAYQSLLDLRDAEGHPKYSIRSLARRLAKDKSYVEDRLQYARAPENVQLLVQENPHIAPRMVRELAHVEDEAMREALIGAVQRDEVDIAGVMQVRKQLQAQASPANPESVSTGDAAPASPPTVPSVPETPVPLDAQAKHLVLKGKLLNDHRQMTKILQRWSAAEILEDEVLCADLRYHIRIWRDSLRLLEEKWLPDA